MSTLQQSINQAAKRLTKAREAADVDPSLENLEALRVADGEVFRLRGSRARRNKSLTPSETVKGRLTESLCQAHGLLRDGVNLLEDYDAGNEEELIAELHDWADRARKHLEVAFT